MLWTVAIVTTPTVNLKNLGAALFTPGATLFTMEGMSQPISTTNALEAIPADKIPWLLIAGLVLVTGAQFLPVVPLLLGVAILMLGSTLAVQHRVPPQLRLLATGTNLLVYLSLYAVFLGAVLHSSSLHVQAPPPWLRLADLAASAWLVIASLQLAVRQLQSAI